MPPMDRYRRQARVKRAGHDLVPSTPDARLRLADALTADCWQIAEAARHSLAGAPTTPPWARSMDVDARAHRRLQARLRELLGRIEA